MSYILKIIFLCTLIKLSYQQAMSKRSTTSNDGSYFYYEQSDYHKDCSELKNKCTNPSELKSGVYYIKLEGMVEPIEVYCDHENHEGGWTVIQRRLDGKIDFDRNWDSYKNGFGFLSQEFWIGNDNLAYLTNQKKYQLHVTIVAGTTWYTGIYNWFRISDEKSLYKLVHLDEYQTGSSNATDSMTNHKNQPFQTIGSNGSCNKNAWWFSSASNGCTNTNLNGIYRSTYKWGTSTLVQSIMKVRPQQ